MDINWLILKSGFSFDRTDDISRRIFINNNQTCVFIQLIIPRSSSMVLDRPIAFCISSDMVLRVSSWLDLICLSNFNSSVLRTPTKSKVLEAFCRFSFRIVSCCFINLFWSGVLAHCTNFEILDRISSHSELASRSESAKITFLNLNYIVKLRIK